MNRALFVILLIALVSGVSSLASGGVYSPICTYASCESGVDVGLSRAPAKAAQVRFCVNGRCRRTEPTQGSSLRFPCEAAPIRVRVSATLFDAHGNRLIRGRRHARLRKLQPNGPDCPPTCYVAWLRFNGHSGVWKRVD